MWRGKDKDNPEMVETPPYPPGLVSIELEQAVLGVFLVNNDALNLVLFLAAEHFYEPLHKRIFAAFKASWDKGRSFSPLTLRSHFDADPALADIGGGEYLIKLAASCVHLLNLPEGAREVVMLAQRRSLYDACQDAAGAIAVAHEEDPVQTALSLAQRFQEVSTGFDAPIFQDDLQVVEEILQDMKRDCRPYPTGISLLDLAMDGGLYPGKSYGFAARKKMGKTILAGTISCNLNISGVKHLFICGEMSPKEIHQRTLSRLLQVDPKVFRNKREQSSHFLQRVAEAAHNSKRCILYKNAPGLTFEELKRTIMLAKVQKKITGFILDYWQLVGGKPAKKSTSEHLDEVAQWIADISRKYDLWSIVMAQLNQEGNTRSGEGMRLAFDQVYQLQAPKDDAARRERWLEMLDTRYTRWMTVGGENKPAFYLNERGPYFEESTPELIF